MGIEGYRESRWILLDYGTVVIHIFDEEMREFYAMEQLWNQAKQVPLPWLDKQPAEQITEQAAEQATEQATDSDGTAE